MCKLRISNSDEIQEISVTLPVFVIAESKISNNDDILYFQLLECFNGNQKYSNFTPDRYEYANHFNILKPSISMQEMIWNINKTETVFNQDITPISIDNQHFKPSKNHKNIDFLPVFLYIKELRIFQITLFLVIFVLLQMFMEIMKSYIHDDERVVAHKISENINNSSETSKEETFKSDEIIESKEINEVLEVWKGLPGIY
jgi:hypothetical protein